MKTYRAWNRLHPDGAPEAYAKRVMVRAAWRAGRFRWLERTAATVPHVQAADPYDPYDTVTTVLAALRALPAGQRVVLVLRYWGGLSEKEIADEIGCSVGTVKSRASRALTALRRPDGPLAEAFAERSTADGEVSAT